MPSPTGPGGGKPDFSAQCAGAAWCSTPCRVAPSGAGSTAHRGLGRTRPSAARARVGGDDRKVRRRPVGSEKTRALYTSSDSGLCASRAERERRAASTGLPQERRGWPLQAAAAVAVLAARAQRRRSFALWRTSGRTPSSRPRRRCRTPSLRRPPAAAEPLSWPLGRRLSDGVAVRSESRITKMARRAGASVPPGGPERRVKAVSASRSHPRRQHPQRRQRRPHKFGVSEETKDVDGTRNSAPVGRTHSKPLARRLEGPHYCSASGLA